MVFSAGLPLRCGRDAGSCAAAVRTSTADAVGGGNSIQLMLHIMLVVVLICPLEALVSRYASDSAGESR